MSPCRSSPRQVIGAIRQERTWPPHIVNRLRLVGQVFAAALARKRSEAGLRVALEENAKLRDQLIDENVYLRDEVRAHDGSVDTMGQSPAIRHVLEDIPVLLCAFVDECAKTIGKRIESISKDQITMLQRYLWPGNVRELRNVVERAVIVSRGERLVIEPPRVRSTGHRRSVHLDDVEREHIRAVLERTR
jgi:transcriptional regulator with GAF, ATPase, and Fis domain